MVHLNPYADAFILKKNKLAKRAREEYDSDDFNDRRRPRRGSLVYGNNLIISCCIFVVCLDLLMSAFVYMQ